MAGAKGEEAVLGCAAFTGLALRFVTLSSGEFCIVGVFKLVDG